MLEPLGDAWGLQHAEAALGRLAQAMGEPAASAVHHGRAAASAERLGFPGAAAMHLMHLAKAQLAADDPAAAATLERAIVGAEQAGGRAKAGGKRDGDFDSAPGWAAPSLRLERSGIERRSVFAPG